MNLKTDSSETQYIFLKQMEYTQALDEMSKQLRCVCLKARTTDDENYTTAPAQKMSDRSKANFGEWITVKQYKEIRGLLNVMGC